MSTDIINPVVTLIPAKHKASSLSNLGISVTRVAAYCRVSTDEEEQLNSYATQVKHYTDYINANPDWELVGIFADEGISGTGTAKRSEFNKMIRMARRHKIDLILCKSISRFSRNTVDFLKYIRELRDLGVNVKFEKENIETISASSEFTLSLYASFAQAESESISKNVTWGIEKSFQSGKVRYQMRDTLGYRLENGKPVIIEKEAETVRFIFKMFTEGHSMGEIATMLTEKGVKRRNGKTNWNRTNIGQILINEKYVGDAVMQKSFTVNCLTHERKKNNGEKTKYYIRDCHDPIIDRETWDRAHLELARRRAETKGIHPGRKNAKKYCFSDLLTCSNCGGHYKRTVWKLGAGRSVGVWRCGTRLDHGAKMCSQGVSIHEDRLHRTVLKIVNNMIDNPESVNIAISESLEKYRIEIEAIDTEITEISGELDKIDAKRDAILDIITGEAFSQFRDELKELNVKELGYKEKLEQLQIQKERAQLETKKVVTARELFINMMPIDEFDNNMIPKLVERIDVISKKTIRVVFRGGVEVEGTVEK